jgi:hypothetical protein
MFEKIVQIPRHDPSGLDVSHSFVNGIFERTEFSGLRQQIGGGRLPHLFGKQFKSFNSFVDGGTHDATLTRLEQNAQNQRHGINFDRYAGRTNDDTACPCPPKVTSTISGGTPRRNGARLQPRPPDTITSQLVREWP